MFKRKVLSQMVAAAAVSSFLVGCGGGSSSGSSASTTTDVTGSAFASYVSGAKVVAMAGVNEIAGPVTTTANGGFKLAIPNEHLKSDLVFKATGGTYTDEATGEQTTSGELSVMVGAGTLKAGSSIHATPASTIISKLMAEHDLSKGEAEAAFSGAFGYLPDTSVAPVDATKANDGASEEAKRAGVRAAAFSQLLKNLGLDKGDHSALLAALAEDLADGTADGKKDGQAVNVDGSAGAMALNADIANKFSTALYDFASNADMNKSGLNTGQVGLIKFNTKAVSENYTFELTPPMMTQVGKAEYKLKVTKNIDGSPITGTPMMMPMMYMAAGHKHSTPHTGCSAVDADGIATCTAYFLMASAMGNGDVMGNWDLMFSVGMDDDKESVHFFPKVMMAMGEDTSRLRLEGAATDSDHVKDMTGNDAGRKYFIYKDSITGMTGDHTVRFFVATQDSMMSFPAINDNGTATGDLAGSVVSLKVGDADAVSNGAGIWEVANIATLVDGEQSSLELKLTVDGELKPVGTFKLTPKSM